MLGTPGRTASRISVFTGPVLRRGDRRSTTACKVPEEFWKVVVAIDDDSKHFARLGTS